MVRFPHPVVRGGERCGGRAGLQPDRTGPNIVLMEEGAYLADPHVSVGPLVAADGGALTWPTMTSLLRAKEYLFTGDRIPATGPVQFGLANRVDADGSVRRGGVGSGPPTLRPAGTGTQAHETGTQQGRRAFRARCARLRHRLRGHLQVPTTSVGKDCGPVPRPRHLEERFDPDGSEPRRHPSGLARHRSSPPQELVRHHHRGERRPGTPRPQSGHHSSGLTSPLLTFNQSSVRWSLQVHSSSEPALGLDAGGIVHTAVGCREHPSFEQVARWLVMPLQGTGIGRPSGRLRGKGRRSRFRPSRDSSAGLLLLVWLRSSPGHKVPSRRACEGNRVDANVPPQRGGGRLREVGSPQVPLPTGLEPLLCAPIDPCAPAVERQG